LTIVNKHDVTMTGLRILGFSSSEASIYLELLKKPATHAQLSTITGINRTTLYRLVNRLEKRGLITHSVNDIGKFLMAADPLTLEADVVTREEQAKRQRTVLGQLMPALEDIKKGYEADFAIHPYEGVEGFKRMLWHELKTTNECLSISFGTLEDCVLDHRWAEKHRQMAVDADYTIREVVNPQTVPKHFTDNKLFLGKHYRQRIIPSSILPIHHLINTYNDTVAIYHIQDGRRVGLEIVSKTYAQMHRAIFEQYWQQAVDPAS
jgi:hypothetical protein